MAKASNSGVGSTNGSAGEGVRLRRFGIFELDLRIAQLRRNGVKVKLQEQPFRVLAQLLECPGEVVTRETLRNRLWPADTFVDFDHSLNAAIRRLRDALGDSAENPTFVETVARRGYRFLAPVTVIEGNGNDTLASLSAANVGLPPTSRFRASWVVAASAAAVLVLLGLKIGLLLARHDPPAYRSSPLTANPVDDRVRSAAISRDGRYLTFADETGLYLRQIDTGETTPLPALKNQHCASISWFPDSIHFIVALRGVGQSSSLWELSAMGGAPRKLLDDGQSPAVSPDGKEIAYVTGPKLRQEIWLVAADGTQPRKVAGEEGDFFNALAWSPTGAQIAYSRGSFSFDHDLKAGIEVLDIRGHRVTRVELQPTTTLSQQVSGPLTWTSDGNLIYALAEPYRQADSNLWRVELDQRARPVGTPLRLTSDSGSVLSISASADGKRIIYLRGVPQPDVYVAQIERSGRITEPERLTMDDRQDFPFDWTADGKAVIFISDRTGAFKIYKQGIDETLPELLVGGKDSVMHSRLNPDGTQLLYVGYPKSDEVQSSAPLMRVPLGGGTPQQVLQARAITNTQCARAPASLCLYSVIAQGQLTFFAFDPFKGNGRKVFQVKDDLPQIYNWSLSPNGTTLAIARGKWDVDEDPRIHLVSLDGGLEHWLTIQGWRGLASLDWAADSKTLWAASSGNEENELLNIDLQGRAHSVWCPKKMSVGWAIPSRDGKYLALHVSSSSANVWMLERP